MTEKELQISNHIQINRLTNLFLNDPIIFHQIADIIPLMMNSNYVGNLDFTYVNSDFSNFFRKDKEYILETGSVYTTSILHPKNFEYIKNTLKNFPYLENKGNVVELYQYARPEGNKDFEWLINYKKFISQNQYFGIYHRMRDLGNSAIVLKKYLGEFALSTSTYQKFQTLTQKEKQILQHIISGKVNKEISELLHISIHTVRTHRNRIWKKLDIKHFKDCLKYQLMYNDIEV